MKTNTTEETKKQIKFTEADKAEVQAMAEIMMRMNNREDQNTFQDSTYGFLQLAIFEFIRNQYGVDLTGVEINWGGNWSWADDIEKAMN